MATASEPYLSDLAADVYSGLTATRQKKLPSKYFYDDLGSKLFEAITLLPEYGLSRADERVLHHAAASLASLVPKPINLSELGSGSGRKTASLLRALVSPGLRYFPIDVSQEALAV